MPKFGRTLAAFVVGGAATLAARSVLDSKLPGGAERWTRTNHQGEPISLLEGPAVTAGVGAATLLAGSASGSQRAAQAIAAVGAGGFGLYDDLEEDTTSRSKGLKGHLGAMAQGQLTTGGLKVLGIGATALVSATLSARARRASGKSKKFSLVDVVLDTAVIAGSANLVNLLDLRPGRALKVCSATASALSLSGSTAGAGILGSAAVAFPGDLGERDMLGDCGANSLGAVLGTAFVQQAPRGARVLGAGAIVALTLLSEKVSFSKVIAESRYLNAVDMWGRRPATPGWADTGSTDHEQPDSDGLGSSVASDNEL